ncbi:MAG: DUF1801 domain-containing protein [Deltaproteobacteria bacterium]
MTYSANSPEEYIELLPEDRREPVSKLRNIIQENIPDGFSEEINYGMIGFVVPKSIYPSGYHCDPKLPLPFINLASQKNFVAFYHMGIFADQKLLEWFISEYPRHSKTKLDMGKSCVRFKKMNDIPYELVGELCSKMTADQWIEIYERVIKR